MGGCSSMAIDPPSKSDIRCGPEDPVPKQLPLARHQQMAPSDTPQRRSRESGDTRDMGRLRNKVCAGVSFNTKPPLPSKSHKSEDDVRVIREKLKATSVLGALSSSQIDDIIGYMSVKVISEQQSVSLTNGLHLVLEGTLVVRKANGKEKRYIQGDIFGHVELLYGGTPQPMRAMTKRHQAPLTTKLGTTTVGTTTPETTARTLNRRPKSDNRGVARQGRRPRHLFLCRLMIFVIIEISLLPVRV